MFKLLLDEPKIDVNIIGDFKDLRTTPLLWCVAKNKKRFYKYLIENDHRNGAKEKRVKPNYQINFSFEDSGGFNVLHFLASHGDIDIMKNVLNIINNKAFINKQNKFKQTPLFYCVAGAKDGRDSSLFECFKLLLSQANIDANVKDHKGATIFVHCFQWLKYKYIKFLFDNNDKYNWNIDFSGTDEKNNDALMYAAEEGDLDLMTLLLDTNKFDIDKPGINGATPLMITTHGTQSNHFNCFKLLLSKSHVDVNIQDEFGRCLIMWCLLNPNVSFAQYLLENNGILNYNIDFSIVDKRGSNILFFAVSTHNIEIINSMLHLFNHTFNINYQNIEKGNTALFSLCYKKRKSELDSIGMDCLALLLSQRGIDLRLKNKDGFTLFLKFVEQGLYSYVKYMIENNAKSKWNIDFTTIDNKENNGIYYAALNGHENTLRLLLNSTNIDINQCNKEGQNALLIRCQSKYSIKKSHFNCFKLLLAHKNINVNIVDKNGMTPLLYCLQNNKESFIKYLIDNDGKFEYTIDFSIKDKDGNNAKEYAKKYCHESIVNMVK